MSLNSGSETRLRVEGEETMQMLMMSAVEKRVDLETDLMEPGGREGRAASQRS